MYIIPSYKAPRPPATITSAERRLMDIRADAITRLRHALHALHWTQRGLAAILGQDERRVRRWLAGTYETPRDVLEWLERLAGFHMDNPPPRRDGGKG